MNKIVNFSDIKKTKKAELTKNEPIHLVTSNEIISLLDDKKFDEALIASEEAIKKFGYAEPICEAFISAVAVSSDYLDNEKFAKYYKQVKEIYNRFQNNETISFYSMVIYLFKLELIKQNESDNFDFLAVFNKIYNDYPMHEDIAHMYSTALLLNLDFFDGENDFSIFQPTIEKFTKLTIDFDDSSIISTEFAKFCYLASIKSDDEQIISKAYTLLTSLKSDYEDEDELISYYCLYIANYLIKDDSFASIKALNEFKEIINNAESFIFKEILFITLNNLIANESYENSKFFINQLKLLIYNSDKDEMTEHIDLIELFAESLSNFSCDGEIPLVTINSEILPIVAKLIEDFGKTEGLIAEYCVILYNMSCLMKFYKEEDAPHIDVLKELENCANHMDSAIPYYCMCLSNLIHLSNEEFCLEVIQKINDFCLDFDENTMPITKNDIRLTSIYAMALANAVDICTLENANDLLLIIKNLLGFEDENSFDIDLTKQYSNNDKRILFHYIRGLTYYIPKLTDEGEKILLNVIVHKIDEYLCEQEL